MIKRLAILWVISTLTLLLLPVLFDKVYLRDWKGAAFAAVVLGLVNCTIGPVLKLVTLPVQFLTIGFFTLVINGVLLMIVAKLAGDGFDISGFWTAFWAAIVYGIVNWIGSSILLPDRRD